jgi:putative transposase
MPGQAYDFITHTKREGLPAEIVLRDRDCMYVPDFEDTLNSAGIQLKRVAYRAPNMNAYIERFVQSIQQECLDKFIAFSQEHIDLLAAEFLEHYHHERLQKGKANVPLTGALKVASTEGEIACRARLGGVLRHYYREAA